MLLDFARVEVAALWIHARRGKVEPLVHVGEEKSGTDGGLIVQPRAAIAMPACTDLEVKRAVHSILLRAKNGRQVLRHHRSLSNNSEARD